MTPKGMCLLIAKAQREQEYRLPEKCIRLVGELNSGFLTAADGDHEFYAAVWVQGTLYEVDLVGTRSEETAMSVLQRLTMAVGIDGLREICDEFDCPLDYGHDDVAAYYRYYMDCLGLALPESSDE